MRRRPRKKTGHNLRKTLRTLVRVRDHHPGYGRRDTFGLYVVLGLFIVTGLVLAGARAYYVPLHQGHIGLNRHWHVKLRIVIDGKHFPIPGSLGVNTTRSGRYQLPELESTPLHTHAGDGVIHIESKVLRRYFLGNFFDLWDKNFSEQCIFNHCNNSTHVVSFFVNGEPSSEFEKLQLEDKQSIIITYEQRPQKR